MEIKNKFFLIFVILLISIPLVLSQKVEITGYVNDYANVIPDETVLNAILQQIHNSGIAEYSIVTVNSLEGRDIESYSLNLAQGVLGDKEKNNGLLLVVAIEDKKYRFEVGRGLEATLNDAKVGRIGRTYLQDNFRAGDYAKGITEASLAVKSILLGEEDSAYYVSNTPQVNMDYNTISNLFWFIFFIIFFILPILFSKNKNKKDRIFNAALGAAFLFGGGGRRGGGGLGGSGGFGGFGGGGFGGGGASGGW